MITKGQVVYCEPGSNMSRNNTDVVEGTVIKVGRKYFEVKIRYRTYQT
jgi:hypothetical protein